MKNLGIRESLQWLRLQQLECMNIALGIYRETRDKLFLEQARAFGKESKNIKQEIYNYEL